MTRYFFDLTGTVWHLKRMPHFSGIQRTIVMMIDAAARSIGPEQVHLSYIDRVTGRHRCFPLTELEPGELIDADALRARLGFGRLARGVHPALRKYQDRPGKFRFHQAVLRLNALVGNERFFRRRNTTLAEWRAFHGATQPRHAAVGTVDFESVARAGDQLVMLDGTWTASRAAAVFEAARGRGLHTSTMLHDLIPVVAPQFATGISDLTFHDWLLQTPRFTSLYLTNSQSTARDLMAFLQTYDIACPVQVVPLAQAPLPLTSRPAAPGPLLSEVSLSAYPKLHAGAGVDERIRALSGFPYALCVGTLEVRKNIWRTALAWDRMRQMTGFDLPKLVFAGRSGWMKADFDHLMTATGNLGGWVEIVEGPSDADLDYLYRNCLFHVMPSLYEGWGLPVGEALSYGKTSVVSNTTSLPEVGGDMVEYCDPMSVDSITEACLRLIRQPERRLELEARIAATRLRSWDDVGADLVRAIGKG